MVTVAHGAPECQAACHLRGPHEGLRGGTVRGPAAVTARAPWASRPRHRKGVITVNDRTTPSAVQPFEFETRIITIHVVDDEPWFRSWDLAVLLDIRERDLLSALDDDEKMRDTVAGVVFSLVSEPGMYSTILRSRKPDAKRFKRWVTHEVLPAIRKTGAYVVSPQALDPLDALQVMLDQRSHLAMHDRAILELGARTERLEASHERMAAVGYANIKGIRSDVMYLNRLGRVAAAIARRDHIPIEKTHSTVWGEVNAWPVDVWDEALARVGR